MEDYNETGSGRRCVETHRIAVDNIAEGMSETYCGIFISLYDDEFHDNCTDQDPTCLKCREAMITDRVKGRGPRKDDPQWLRSK